MSNNGHGASSLVVVGTGIQWAAHATLAAQAAIRDADSVLFAVADAWSARWIRELNPRAESLKYPRDGRPRRAIYDEMVTRIVAELGRSPRVCAAFYGSPSVLARPAHESVRRAREAGHQAAMLPGVSSLDCLFADLGVDPGDGGCQLFEASDFLRRERRIDVGAHLVLFQIAMAQNRGTFSPGAPSVRGGLRAVEERLLTFYPPEHTLVLYEASAHPLTPARKESIRLRSLHEAALSEITTLYVPPRETAIDSAARATAFNETGEWSTP
jgi:precorrin-6B methylase 1